MSDALSPPGPLGADLIGAVAAESNEELTAALQRDFETLTAAQGRFLVRMGEFNRRQAYRDEGATSLESWTAERFGVSTATARGYAQVGEKACDIPHLLGSLCAGDISLDKVRAVVDVATPVTDQQLLAQARECTVRDLVEVARSTVAAAANGSGSRPTRSDYDRRFVRFNDGLHTISAQLPAEAYAETKACIDARIADIPSDGETPLDQRRCDALLEVVRSQTSGSAGSAGKATTASPYMVVAHVPMAALVDDAQEHTVLAGELERDGLIDGETVKRIACDALLVVAVDDDIGHTMYEGRARRFPTGAQRREVMRRDRHCRFPGCTNVTFTNVHHIVPWKPGGRTDLDNLVLLCEFHHHRVHSRGWTLSGNANEELAIVGPTGRVMTSRPSLLWARVTAGAGTGLATR
jgi:hypothetical protein